MFGKTFVRDLISRSAENDDDRRKFLKSAGVAGLGVVGASVLSGTGMSAANAADAPSDSSILNFALNLEYLEAEFYSYAVHGHGLPTTMTTGSGDQGAVRGGHEVPFTTNLIKNMAWEIAGDETNHVRFLRTALGAAKVAQPNINLKESFTAAAQAAGLIKAGQTFDPFANENNFLLGAFIFEDVGVTAYKGAAPLITNKGYLEAAAGILAVEAYHAGSIRSALLNKGLYAASNAISAARDSLDGPSDDDQGTSLNGNVNIVPTDANGIVYSRNPGQVLNIVYLNKNSVNKGGFFPWGVNGTLNTSGANG